MILPGLPALSVPARAGVLMVADFDEGAAPLDIGSGSSISTINNVTPTFVASSAAEPALGNRGYSLRIQSQTGTANFLLLNFGSNVDLSSYKALSFWIRADNPSSTATLKVDLKLGTTEPGFRPDIRNFLPNGVTSSWQKVVVPINALVSGLITNNTSALATANTLIFQTDSGFPTMTVYIDDVLFHTKAAPVWVDNFNDGAEPGAFGFNSADYVDGVSGATLANAYDTGVFASSPAGFKITYTTAPTFSSTHVAVAQLLLDDTRNAGVAADVSGCNMLAFNVKGDSNQNGKPLGIGLSDDAIDENVHATTVTLTTDWQTIKLDPISGFGLTSSTNIAQVQFWFNHPSGDGPVIGNLTSGNVYVDDVRFLDTSSPTAPSALLDDGASVTNNYFFGVSNTVSFTAPTNADATLESVRFEHDGLTGGTTWYTVYINTNTSSASHSFSWTTTGLSNGTTYQVRAVAMDVAGNLGVLAFTGIELNPSCDVAQSTDTTAPAITHTAITSADGGQALSVPVSVADNTRVAAVTLFYRAKGASSYSQVSYSLTSPCNTSFAGTAAIPASAVTAAGVEYYIQATDSLNTSTFASAASPQSVSIKDATKQTEITPSGGTVTLGDSNTADGETSVTIPAGALDEAVTITLTQKSVTEVPSGASIGQDQPFAAFEFGPSGTVFARPVTVTLLYPDADQDGFVESAVTGLNTTTAETGLKVFVYDGAAWRSLGGTVNASQNTVTAQTFHFSTFAVFPASSLTKARLRPPEKIITPLGSPGVNDAAHFGGSAAGARIEIYDITGRVVRRLYDQTVWDGRDSDGNIVESGVYFYHAEIEGEKVDGSLTVAR